MGMKVAIAGGTGFIGKHIIDFYSTKGDEVFVISRSHVPFNQPNVRCVTWGELERTVASLENCHAFINLAGESINQRWTPAAKERILQSRLSTARKMADITRRLHHKPGVVVNASGMSIYGTSEHETYDETSAHRIVDFLSGVVEKWEKAIDEIEGTRVIKLRVGLVLGIDGGAFPKIALPYKMGVGGRIGSGRQWLSWIHIDDMVRLIDYCITNNAIQGPVNATAPQPVTNDQFGRTLGKVMRRPHYFPVPEWVFKFIFGELATLLLEGQKVIPRVALNHGFTYRHATIDEALRHLVGKNVDSDRV